MSCLSYSQTPRGADFHGAAILDAQGREIPITEAMILRACEELEQAWRYPKRPTRKAG
jgi:hypothetical protein